MSRLLFRLVLPVLFCIAFYYLNISDDLPLVSSSKEDILLQELREQCTRLPDGNASTPETKCNVAVGYNTNLDLIVDALEFFKKLLESEDKGEGSNDWDKSGFAHREISTLSSALETFTFYANQGSAAERFVSDPALFATFVSAAESLEEKTYFLGGNAGLMALRFAKNKCNVLLGGKIGPKVRQLLDPAIHVPETPEEKEEEEEVQDEVHLILEFTIGEEWQGVAIPRSNRLILVHDLTNSRVQPAEPFHEAIAEHHWNSNKEILDQQQGEVDTEGDQSQTPMESEKDKEEGADVVVIAGLHLLEAQDNRQERLRQIVALIEPLHKQKVPIHFELASVGTKKYMKELGSIFLPEADSLGLNEQELGALYFALGGTKGNMSDFTSPSLKNVASALAYVFSVSGERLSRIHFHCLEFHIIAERSTDCERCGYSLKWNNGLAAASAGSLVATAQACHAGNPADPISRNKVTVSPKFSGRKNKQRNVQKQNQQHRERSSNPGASASDDVQGQPHDGRFVRTLRKRNIKYHVAPVLICKKPEKTVGLGDAISATGLAVQLS